MGWFCFLVVRIGGVSMNVRYKVKYTQLVGRVRVSSYPEREVDNVLAHHIIWERARVVFCPAI